MFKLSIRTGANRGNEEIMSLDMTPAQAFEQKGISTDGATVAMNGRVLAYADFDKSFRELGIADGASVILHSVVKAESAC